jgi:hypothetical protein
MKRSFGFIKERPALRVVVPGGFTVTAKATSNDQK